MWINRLNKYIAWSFYAIFFAVPLVIHPSTYELFEFNKMWIVFGLSLLILFFWTTKMILQSRINIRRTPLDIPLLLFLASQLISTIWSLDPHVSFWGYYSRFNGGFLSTLTYVFLYYAYASNLAKNADEGVHEQEISYKLLFVSVLSGFIVSLWGFPSHFGYDPTCFAFRGQLNVDCWTDAFHPTVRIFSTLGQPNWLAAFLSVTIPLTFAFSLVSLQAKKTIKGILLAGITVLSYICLLFTRSQSGFAAFWVGFLVMLAILMYRELQVHSKFTSAVQILENKTLIILVVLFGLTTLIFGSGVGRIDDIRAKIISYATPHSVATQSQNTATPPPAGGELGGTDSGQIRLYVWQGALKIWREHPLFGTGVETFAFAYYQNRPLGHNLTSEWDYLYNKAHNEYLNYAATTGIFGLGTYLLFFILFLFLAVKKLTNSKFQTLNSKEIQNQNEKNKHSQSLIINQYLGAAIIAGIISLLISNFFGFSVVIVNLFLFILPIVFLDMFALLGTREFFAKNVSANQKIPDDVSSGKITLILVIFVIIAVLEYMLAQFWVADTKYAYGYNLDHANAYSEATPYLADAVALRPGEDLFKDEYALNLSTMALLAAQQKQNSQAVQFAEQAKTLDDQVVANHPNNVVYFKNRTRVYYALAQLNKQFLPETIKAIKRAHELAPTDAKILYNEALIIGQNGDRATAEALLKQTVTLKPNYTDAYYALALFYSQDVKEEKDQTKIAEAKKNAQDTLNYYLKHIAPGDKKAIELLKSVE